MTLDFWKICVLFALCSSAVLAQESCSISEEKDETSLVQLQHTVRRSSSHSERMLDERDFVEDASKDATEIAEAKMLYKKTLIERSMAFNKFEEAKAWADAKIAEGKADLQEVKTLEQTTSKAAKKREDAAKALWKGALSKMVKLDAATKATTSSKSKTAASQNDLEADTFKIVTKAEKHAQAVLLENLKSEAGNRIKKHIETRKDFEKKATSDAADYVVAYNKTLQKAAAANSQAVEFEANLETQAEEDIIMKNARSKSQKGHAKGHNKKGDAKGHNKKGHAKGHNSFIQSATHATPAGKPSLELDFDDILEAADILKLRDVGENDNHMGPEYKILRSAIETSVKAESNNTMEDAAKIADGTRLLVYGNISEYAIRLAAAKMGYKKALIETKMSANQFKWYKDWGQDKITNGKAVLKKVESAGRAKAEAIQLKLTQAKASWEGMSAKMLSLTHAKDGDKLKAMAEKKAEQSMNDQLAKKVQEGIQKKVSKMSEAAHAYQKNQTKGDHTTEKGYVSNESAADFKAALSKIDKELASQEKTMGKDLILPKKL